MKSRILLLALAAIMLFALTACDGGQTNTTQGATQAPTQEPTEEPTQAPTLPTFEAEEPTQVDGVYQLSTPGHLLYMAANPDKTYALADDIDMCGTSWTPVEDFTGSLTGVIHEAFNYTISNVVIEAAEGDTNVGFFRVVSGTIKDLNFKNVTLSCPGTFTGNMGLVAGQVKTELVDVEVKNGAISATVKDANVGLLCGKADVDVSSCYVAGSITANLAEGKSYVGGGVGYAGGNLMSLEARTNLTLEGTAASGAAGGVAGYNGSMSNGVNYGGHVKVTATESYAVGALIGELAGTGSIISSYNCARSMEVTGAVTAGSYCGVQDAAATINNCVIRDLTNIEDVLPQAEKEMRQQVVDYAYIMATYRWTPSKLISYNCSDGTHPQTYHAGTTYFGMPYTHHCSSLAEFLYYLDENGVVSDEVPGDTTGLNMLGNDCADFVFWAWSQVEADLTYTLTSNAICQKGVLPVGNYGVSSLMETKIICRDNGAAVMYEAYASGKMGDAILYGPGHMRLMAESPYVFRDENGVIDPQKSYMLIHEQGASVKTLAQRHTTCAANKKYTFAELFAGNYIPVTMEAYSKGEIDKLEATFSNKDDSISGVGIGAVTTNYRPDRVTMRITDAQGNVILEKMAFPSDGKDKRSFAVSVWLPDVEAIQYESGKEYTYEVLVTAGGQEVCARTFKYTA